MADDVQNITVAVLQEFAEAFNARDVDKILVKNSYRKQRPLIDP
ncbi:MAG: hypothetical protein OEM50_04130 [Gammaproteobacteria bacterium]|nr:hypothetical protein [Gammaproteobacteria bacterium]